jgi:hypothetical protein
VCSGGWYCDVDWALVVGAIVGFGQIAAIVGVGWWAWTSVNRQIAEVRKATESQGEQFQKTLAHRDAQQRVEIAISLVRLTYQKQSFGVNSMSPLEAAEFLNGLADRQQLGAIVEIDKNIKSKKPETPERRALIARTAVACVVLSNHYGEVGNLLSRRVADARIVYEMLTDLAREALPILTELEPLKSKPENVRRFIVHADRYFEWVKAQSAEHEAPERLPNA